MLDLLGVFCGLLLLFLLSVCLFVFRVHLERIRFQAIDRGRRDELRTYKSIAILFDNINQVVQSLILSQVFMVIGIGVLLPIFLNIVFLDSEFFTYHFWSILVLLYISIVVIYYGLEVFVTKITSNVINVEKFNRIASVIILITKILFPITWAVRYFVLRTCSILNLSTQSGKQLLSSDLEFLIPKLEEAQFSLSTEILNIIRNAIRLPDLDVSDVLLPRSQIQYLDLDDTILQNLEKARKTGHTRFPLCKGGIDHCLGIIHIKDIFQYQGDMDSFDFSKFQRQLIRFEEATQVETALKKLQKFKIHMALVVDEFGGTIGLLTLEDILEELVGNIQDEFDHEDAMIIPITKNTYKVSGLTSIQELESFFNIKIENDKVSTFGGLITATLGRIPEKNERIKLLPWSIRITEVSKQRIISTIVRDISSEKLDL